MITAQVKFICDVCGQEASIDAAPDANGSFGLQLPKQWQVVAISVGTTVTRLLACDKHVGGKFAVSWVPESPADKQNDAPEPDSQSEAGVAVASLGS